MQPQTDMDARGFSNWSSPIEQIRRSVVLRLFAVIFAFSCGVTLVLTAVQLYREYRQGVTLVHQRLVEVDRSYRDSLAEALWRLDRAQLDLELRGVLSLGGISAVEVREAGAQPMVVAAGASGGAGRALSRDFPLMRRVQGVDRMIGMLHVEATLSELYRSLARTAMLILVNQAANTFLVAVFITWLLNRLVTRHLAAIARAVGRYDHREPPQPLVLARTPPAAPDELDRVVSAINAMGARVYRAYLDERAAAAEREARNAAEAANSAKSAFLASMSHELRTPLNGILGYAQILRRDPTLDRTQHDAVGAILRCGEHLLGLIHDVLDFATIEAGRLRVEIGDVSVVDAVAAIRDVMAVKAVERQILFHCDIAPDAPRAVRADERRLRQVLLNLLANAIKFTALGGAVGLRVSRAGDDGVLFEVYDNGIGIEADQLERIFLPFEQGESAGGRDRGIGLGLAISRQFVRAMGGDIVAESTPGCGSTFRFVLPGAAAASRTAVVHRDEARVTGYLGVRHTILVVDDIEVNRAMVSDLLASVGFTVQLAVSCDAALEAVQRERVSLVLTDIVMPGASGLDLIGALRARSDGARLPIVVMSASSSREDVRRSVAAGADAFLSKPLDLDRLLSEIGRLLSITWTYESAPQRDHERDLLGEAWLDAPHGERMQTLLALARLGDMHGVRRWAQALAADDARYAPFASALDALARACESKALLAFVERHLRGRDA